MSLWPKLSTPANVAAWSIAFVGAYFIQRYYQQSKNAEIFAEAERNQWNNAIKLKEEEKKKNETKLN